MTTLKTRLFSIIIWSVIAAAFIGPGTLTTASSAGAGYGFQLLWALVFAVIACVVLQEATARVSIATSKELGVLFKERFSPALRYFVAGAVIFGCAAYQAGNVLGAISGIGLLLPFNKQLLVMALVVLASALLYTGNYKTIARILGALVGIMGVVFMVIIFNMDLSFVHIASGLRPAIPAGSGWLVLGLVGTTIVPYNLFLGAGLGKGQTIGEMRTGLFISIIIGGIISMAILITGTLITGEMSFDRLAAEMGQQLGPWAVYLLAAGLFAAGFTSSLTAPLASAFIGRSFFGKTNSSNDKAYHLGWAVVVLAGLVIGLLEVKPIPVIIMAQALNGLILPVVAVFLWFLVNDRTVVPARYLNSRRQNIIFFFVLLVVVGIGLSNVASAFLSVTGLAGDKQYFIMVFSVLITGWAGFRVYRSLIYNPA